ncbi:dynactin p62 [Saitoella complicata NRRL Y-17804]|uniref:dynactin p62 n=1 Tax=Saitoella complicata (strain BCRC 22490 / CBS 7301 / JCM 7358 / NBRC 10748 / NRRL Y-17804) TaxID=698492 RepID=UPI000867AEE2|nr:dynactin p62 [Saitoella complicata NRRL Y-17804]ODQ50939.1 dynactin p62 [Saitoella complicata NRRL Y-17804]
MGSAFLHIHCPCADSITTIPPLPPSSSTASAHPDTSTHPPGPPSLAAAAAEAEEEVEDSLWDPKAPRSQFNTFPLSNLYFCEECQSIRCPRCVQEEVVCWFCPWCMFEVPATNVRSDHNRCARNCLECPRCSAPLSLHPLPTTTTPSDPATGGHLVCDNCDYTSSSSHAITFPKPTQLVHQLHKLHPTPPETRFDELRKHWMLKEASSGRDEKVRMGMERLMGVYAARLGGGVVGRATARIRSGSVDVGEGRSGLTPPSTAVPEVEAARYVDTATESSHLEALQRMRTLDTHDTLPGQELRPQPPLLRTKRAKRCRECRHILVRPESKPVSIRWRMGLFAMNYVPSISISPLSSSSSTKRFLLKVTNPLFDPIQIFLATPSTTHSGGQVTLTCPEFTVGANEDVVLPSLSDLRVGSGSKREEGEEEKRGRSEGGGVWDEGMNWGRVLVEMSAMVGQELEGEGAGVELPFFVRVRYATEEGKEKEKERELGFWAVVGC